MTGRGALLAVLCGSAAVAQQYLVTTIDPPAEARASSVSIVGLNNAGEMTVQYRDAAQNGHSALRSATGAYTPIEYPGATDTWAAAMNNVGQVAGFWVDANNGTHGFVRGAGGKFDSFELPGGRGTVTGINDRGEIVGNTFDGLSVGFLRSAGGAITILQLGSSTTASGINNAGEIAGWYVQGGSYGVFRGFVRSPDGKVRVVDLPGTLAGTQLAGINNKGQLAVNGPGAFVLNPDLTSAGIDRRFAPIVRAIDDNGRLAGTMSGGRGFLAVPAAGTQPSIRAAMGVESASGFGGSAAIAPGTWVEIYGAHLSSTTRAWSASDFNGSAAPTSLDGVRVTINGRAAFVSYVSPGQVNAQAPGTLTEGPAVVTVTNASGTSNGYNTTVHAIEPALLTVPTSQVGDALVATRVGNTIVFYGIGFGATTPDVAAGQIAGGADQVQVKVEVWAGAKQATVVYAGHAPGTVGLYQFNVALPEGSLNDYLLVYVNGGRIGRDLSLPATGPG